MECLFYPLSTNHYPFTSLKDMMGSDRLVDGCIIL